MKLVYTSALEDHVAFNCWYAESQPHYKSQMLRSRLILSGGWAAIFLALASALKKSAGNYTQDFYFLLALAIFGAVWVFMQVPTKFKERQERCIRDKYKDGKGEGTIFGEHEIEVVGDDLLEKTKLAQTSFKVSALSRIVDLPDYVFIMTGSGGFVIPRSKVKSGDLAVFLNDLRKKMH